MRFISYNMYSPMGEHEVKHIQRALVAERFAPLSSQAASVPNYGMVSLAEAQDVLCHNRRQLRLSPIPLQTPRY